MLRGIQQVAVIVFIICVVILTVVSVLAIWDVFGDDVLYKSLSTIGVISFASFIVILAAKAVEKYGGHSASEKNPFNPTN